MDIELKDIQVKFPGQAEPLLEIANAKLDSGARLLLRGASGSGKTTLLHMITGLQRPTRGDIRLDTQWLGPLGEGALCNLRRDAIGFVFQRLNILDHLTATENVQLGSAGRPLPRTQAVRALKLLNMESHADKLAYQLSLGEQQRVAVARVLALSPRLIIADEPTASLDEANAHRVLDALFEACTTKTTLIVATHDERITGRFEQQWTVEDRSVTQ